MSLDDETILMLTAYQDGELSPSETLVMEHRIAAEPELQVLALELQNLSRQLKGALGGDAPPEGLRGRIVSQIGLSDAPPVQRATRQWLAIAASLLIGVLVGGGVVAGLTTGRHADLSVSETVFAAHLRSLVAPQPFDIASSDRHVVKPWFNGKVTIAPSAPDLGSEGFALIGGRIDIVAGVSVPVLVYRRDRHIISVTVLPRTTEAADEGEEKRDGSNIHRWSVGDLTYWAVSDLNAADMRRFVAAFKAAA